MNPARRHLLRATAAGAVAAASGQSMADTVSTPPACHRLGLQGEVNLLGNSFPAIQHIARIAESCSSAGLRVRFKLTPQARSETELAFGSSRVSPFDAAVVSMGVFSTLHARGRLYPMTDLVRKHGERYRLEERMLVRVDGEVMALAFMQNTQNLYLRQDLFERHRLGVPRTYAQMLQAAAVIRRAEHDFAFPIAQGFAKGFDLATEFTNVFAGLGGRFFEPGTAKPVFANDLGEQAIETLRSLLPFMTPNALASNADDVMNQLQQGRAAMGVLWASRAARMDDPVASRVAGKVAFAAAPAVRDGGPPAAHLWWDGVVMPRNGGPRREATFLVMMDMLSEAAVHSGNDLTIWVRSMFKPGRFGTGVELARLAGARPWPGEPFFALAHQELGKVLPDALVGDQNARSVLRTAAAAYVRAARDKGFTPDNARAGGAA